MAVSQFAGTLTMNREERHTLETIESVRPEGASVWPRAMGLSCLSPFREGLCDLFASCHAPSAHPEGA